MRANDTGDRAAIAAIDAWIAQNPISLAQLAERAGIDEGTLGAFMRGERRPQRKTLSALEEAMGWEPGSIRKIIVMETIPDDEKNVSEAGHTSHNGQRDTAIFRKPPEMSEATWELVKDRMGELWEFTLYQAEQERKRQQGG